MKLHFEECPHNCNANGQLFDRALGRFINCPYCEEKRKEAIESGVVNESEESKSIHEELGFSDKYLTSYFEFDLLIPEMEKPLIDQETYSLVRDALNDLRGTLSRGEMPSKSMCFGLARKGYADRLAFPMLALAYEKGLGSGKFLSSRVYYSYYIKDKDLQEYYDLDLLFVLVNSGSSYKELMCIRGLMEARAVASKPTIFVTNNDIDECLLLLGSIDDESYYLASPYFIERTKTKDSHSYASDNLRGTGVGLGISVDDLHDL